MANVLTGNPVYIDDVGADITVSDGIVTVSMITVSEDNSAAAKVVFIDNDSNVMVVIQVAQNATQIWTPAQPHCFQNGLIYDESASSIDDGDIVLVYIV